MKHGQRETFHDNNNNTPWIRHVLLTAEPIERNRRHRGKEVKRRAKDGERRREIEDK